MDEVEGRVLEPLGVARASSLAVESVWAAVSRARPGLEEMTLKRVVEKKKDEAVAKEGAGAGEEVEEKKEGGEAQVVVGEEEEKVTAGVAEAEEEEEEEVKMVKRDWLGVIQDVLEYGRMTCGVFGRVESSFKVRFQSHFPIYVYPSLTTTDFFHHPVSLSHLRTFALSHLRTLNTSYPSYPSSLISRTNTPTHYRRTTSTYPRTTPIPTGQRSSRA